MADEVRVSREQLRELSRVTERLNISMNDIVKAQEKAEKALYKIIHNTSVEIGKIIDQLGEDEAKKTEKYKQLIEEQKKASRDLRAIQFKYGEEFAGKLELLAHKFFRFSQDYSKKHFGKEWKWTIDWEKKWYGKLLIKVGGLWSKFVDTKYYRIVSGAYEKIKSHIASLWSELLGPLEQWVNSAWQGVKMIYTGAIGMYKLGKKMWTGVSGYFKKKKEQKEQEKLAQMMAGTAAAAETGNTYLAEIDQTLHHIFDGIKTNTEVQERSFKEGVKEKLRQVKDKGKSIFSSAFGGIKDMFGGVGNMFGGLLKLAPKLLKFLGPLALGFSAFTGVMKGWDDKEAERLFGDSGLLSKIGASVSHMISDLTLGLIDPETVAGWIKNIGKILGSVGEWIGNGITALREKIIDVLPDFVKKWLGIEKGGENQAAGKKEVEEMGETFAEKFTKAMQTGVGTVGKGLQKGTQMVAPYVEKAGKAAGAAIEWAGEKLGFISAKEESGGRGAGTISSGKGDLGGVSYGTHQLSSKTGTLQKFLESSGYAAQFAGLTPGTKEFNEKWKALAASDKNFGAAQHDYITKTHFAPVAQAAKGKGIDVGNKGIQEALYSLGVQHGPEGAKKILDRALAGKEISKMTSTEILDAIYKERGKTTAAGELAYFKSSSKDVQQSIMKRYERELDAVKKLSAQEMAKAPAEPGSEAVRNAEKEKARLDTELAQQQTKELKEAMEESAKQNAGDIVVGQQGGGATLASQRQLQEPPTTIAGNQTVTWIMSNNYA
mgnify:FL=1